MDRCTGGVTAYACVCGRGGRVGCIGLSGHDPTRHASASKPTSSTEWQLGTLNGLSWSGLTRGLTSSGWTAGCVEPRYDKAMRLRCRASAGLQFELQRHLQIHPLRDFVFVVAAGAVVVGTRLQTPPRTLALGLRACGSPASLGRVALPIFGRHPDQPTVHLSRFRLFSPLSAAP